MTLHYKPVSISALHALVLALAAMLAQPPAAGWAQQGDQLYYVAGQMPSGRQMLGAAVVGDHLYALGGNDLIAYHHSVLVSRIDDDGKLSPFRDTTPLPQPLAYIGNSTLSRGNIIYVAGGNVHAPGGPSGGTSMREVWFARALPNGDLARWESSAPFPGPPVQVNAAVQSFAHLYVIGGADDNNALLDVVYRAPFMPDGSLGPWAMDTKLPMPMWFHCAGLVRDRIVVWSGSLQGGTRTAETLSARIQADGSLTPWTRETPLPVPFAQAQGISVSPFFISFAGIHQDRRSIIDAVLFNMLHPATGSLTGWSPVMVRMSVARYAAGAFDPARNTVFLVGGREGASLASGENIATVYGFRVLGDGADVVRQVSTPADVASVTSPSAQPVSAAPPAPSAPPPGAQAAPAGPAPAVTWFSVNDGFQLARQQNKPLLVVLGSPNVPRAMEFWNNVCMSPGFAHLATRFVCAVVDASKDPSTAMRVGVYRLPAVVVVSPAGQITYTQAGNITLADLQAIP